MQHRLKVVGLYFYITDHPMKSKSGTLRNKAERHLKRVQVERMQMEKGLLHCELCGNSEEKLQMHHLYAQSIFPEMALNQNNTMLLCKECHNQVHNNPFLWCELINQRMPDTSPVEKTNAIVAQPPYQVADEELLKFEF